MQQADQETQISSLHSETVSFNCVIHIEKFFFPPPARPPPPPKKRANPVSRPALLAFVASPEPSCLITLLPRACRYFGHVVKFNKPSDTGDKNFMFTERLEAARMSIKLSPTEVWYREVPYTGQARFLQTLKIFLT